MLMRKIFVLADRKGGKAFVSSLDAKKKGKSEGTIAFSQTVSPSRVDCIYADGLVTNIAINNKQNIKTSVFDFIFVVIYYMY